MLLAYVYETTLSSFKIVSDFLGHLIVDFGPFFLEN